VSVAGLNGLWRMSANKTTTVSRVGQKKSQQWTWVAINVTRGWDTIQQTR